MLEYRGVSKWFYKGNNRVVALEDVNIKVREGEFLSVIGPSGCGKSTLLNMAAGLMRPNAGSVTQDGRGQISAINTSVGYITQRDNLLPWATVHDNIVVALAIRHVPRSSQKDLVRRYVELMGLTGFERHYPAELSGGMRKRVALARTLIYDPQTVLMDEPFSALDAQVKMLLHEELLRVWEGTSKTILFITHDLQEAITLSDRVVVLTARPGTVKLTQPIDLPRPRDPYTLRHNPRFVELFDVLWAALREDLHKGEEA